MRNGPGNSGTCRPWVCWLLAAVSSVSSAAQVAKPAGDSVYGKYCAKCHGNVGPRVPTREALTQMAPARILRTLDFGAMMSIAYPMRRDEREAVANFLGKGKDDFAPSRAAFCGAAKAIMSGRGNGSWTGWGPTSANTRFQDAASAGLAAGDIHRLELAWAYAFPGDIIAFAAPTMLDGTVFVGSAGGTVQALDAITGCLHWVFQANGPVRAAMTIAGHGAETSLVFSDQNGWVYAVDARTGTARWSKRVDEHEATRLTGSIAIRGDLAFIPAASWEETRALDPAYPCCTFRGSVTAVRVSDGAVVWKTFLVDPPKKTGVTEQGRAKFGPSGASVWSTPTVDSTRGVLYITTGDNYSAPATPASDAVLALDLKTGRIVWLQQTLPNDVWNAGCGGAAVNCPANSGPDFDFGASAMLVRTPSGRDVLVAGQKSGVVYGLDPARRGKVLWQARVGKGGRNGGIQWGMASDGRKAYVSVSDVVSLQNVIGGAPIGDAQLDPVQGGGLTALDVLSGSKVWFAPSTPCNPPRAGCSPAQPGALTAIPGAVFSGSMDGHIRAFSSNEGTMLWDFDTERSYSTVNGIPGKGGSLDGAGPVVAGNMMFVNSGYPRFGGTAGNVLLAFRIAGQR